MERALRLQPRIVGVNNRNLKDFTIDLCHTERLAKYMDEFMIKIGYNGKRPVFVSESGVSTDDDIRFLKKSKANALLIGRAFMESENPKEKALGWKKVYNNG